MLGKLCGAKGICGKEERGCRVLEVVQQCTWHDSGKI